MWETVIFGSVKLSTYPAGEIFSLNSREAGVAGDGIITMKDKCVMILR
jgi:hypothetical protein